MHPNVLPLSNSWFTLPNQLQKLSLKLWEYRIYLCFPNNPNICSSYEHEVGCQISWVQSRFQKEEVRNMLHEIVNNEAGNPNSAYPPTHPALMVSDIDLSRLQCVDTLCRFLQCSAVRWYSFQFKSRLIHTLPAIQSHAPTYISHPIESFASQPFCSFGFIHLRVGFVGARIWFCILRPLKFPSPQFFFQIQPTCDSRVKEIFSTDLSANYAGRVLANKEESV